MKRRKLSRFGKILSVTLGVTIVVCFILLLGFTGSCELGHITVKQYVVRAVPCLSGMGGSMWLYNKIFE